MTFVLLHFFNGSSHIMALQKANSQIMYNLYQELYKTLVPTIFTFSNEKSSNPAPLTLSQWTAKPSRAQNAITIVTVRFKQSGFHLIFSTTSASWFSKRNQDWKCPRNETLRAQILMTCIRLKGCCFHPSDQNTNTQIDTYCFISQQLLSYTQFSVALRLSVS